LNNEYTQKAHLEIPCIYLCGRYSNTPTSFLEESVTHLTSSEIVEQRVKEKQMLNIATQAKRKEDDIKKCSSLFQTYLGLEKVQQTADDSWLSPRKVTDP